MFIHFIYFQGWTKPNAFHVCITSYKLVLQDHQAFRRKSWRYLILDEAQNIKNFKSQRWQSLLNFNRYNRKFTSFFNYSYMPYSNVYSLHLMYKTQLMQTLWSARNDLFDNFSLKSLFSQSEEIVAHRYSSSEQSNGAVVSHALSHAARFPVPSWV